MNGMTLRILATAMLLFAWAATALAIGLPHETDSVKGYLCNSCHAAQNTLGTTGSTAFNNVCLTCHNSTDPYAKTKAFTLADFANPWRTYTSARPGVVYQTSHNWIGGDTVPKAGAQPPVDPLLNKTTVARTIACARCHSVHSAYSSVNNSSPHLRTKNNEDSMCLDCHRVRKTANHTLGTHPVTMNYAAKAAARPTEFYATPQNANPANPTSAMKISPLGAVVCTTCHGVHFTDSNSRTFHTASSARLGHLSSAKGRSAGMLLRTNMFGASATGINICTNCHKTTDVDANARVKNHNGSSKQQNVQCADCHGGHVDAADSTTPNVFLINRYMNLSTSYGAIRNRQVFFQSTSASLKNYNKDGFGVCIGCHPTLPGTIGQHLSSTDATVCNSCHTHSQGFSANCTTCHGFPPQAGTAGGPSGYAKDGVRDYSTSGVYKNESLTPHSTHAAGGTNYSYSCDQCHKGYSHNTGTFQDVFITPAGTIASTNGGNPTYNKALGNGFETCTTTYCHSDGAGTYKSPLWAGQKNTIAGQAGECSACHLASPNTTRHPRHIAGGVTGMSYTCVTCHAATVNGSNTIINRAKHVDGNKDILFSGSIGANPLSGSNCATVYCHTNGKGAAAVITPVWSNPATGQCGGCHDVSAGIAGAGKSLISSNAHFAHMSSTYGPKLYLQPNTTANSCSNCHTYTGELTATHVNGTVDVISANCTTNCHKQGAVWSGGRVTCESCHTGALSVINGMTAPSKANFTVSGHGQAGVNYTASQQCASCHDKNSAHISAAIGTYKRIAVNNNTLCSGCHNYAAQVPTASKQNIPTHVIAKTTAEESSPSMDCKVCHDVHGTSNIKMVKTTIVFGALTSTITYASSNDLVQLVPPYRGVCQTCHTLTNHYKRNVNEGVNHPTTGCLNCHVHKDAYAFKPKACDYCHGYPPAPKGFVPTQANFSTARLENYSGGGGAHVKAGHILTNVRPTQGFSPCVVCHNDGASAHVGRTAIFNPMTSPTTLQKKANTSVRVDAAYKFNSTKPLDSSQYRKAAPDNTGSCWNVSCHFQPTPRWSNDK